VNVWTPLGASTKAPVILFVHGGAFIAGSTNAPCYDGTAFARDGVVFVSANYRLGVAGFLHLPDAPDNRGMLDVIAALGWIRDNITAFGGDPDNVTLMGQSAGAIIVSSLLSDPAANGLFRRAVIESGSGTGTFTKQQASMVTAEVGNLLGMAATATTLAGVDDATLVDLMPRLSQLDLSTDNARAPLGGITVFGLVLEEQPVDAVNTARDRLPDLLIGSNTDESALYVAPQGLLAATTAEDVHAAAARFDSDPERLVASYRTTRPAASDAHLRVAILSDGMFLTGTRLLVQALEQRPETTTFVYEFGWQSDALRGQLGASHLMELPFVFDCTHIAALHGDKALLGSAQPPEMLADRMHEAWVSFAATGNPGWPAHTAQQPAVQRIGTDWVVTGLLDSGTGGEPG
jgi:para-nitrobenzyl esterase